MSPRTYVIQEQIGTCRTCGQEADLREGYCADCVPPDVLERMKAAIAEADVVVVAAPCGCVPDRPCNEHVGAELLVVELAPHWKGRPS